MLPNHRRRKPTPTGATPPTPTIQRQPTSPPTVVAYEDVTASCGHPEKFGLFEVSKDRYRAERRQKLTERPCQACRQQKRREEEAAAQLRRAMRLKRAQDAGGVSERLPDGARFAVAYDAASTQWTGTLTVRETVFTDTASGVFRLLQRLDGQYRETVPKAEAEKVG